jgi:hypothetical protein
MRALYNRSEDGSRKLPQILSQDMEIEVGKSTIQNANFTEKYSKLQENTKL